MTEISTLARTMEPAFPGEPSPRGNPVLRGPQDRQPGRSRRHPFQSPADALLVHLALSDDIARLPAFLDAEVAGIKVVIGDGPGIRALSPAYPHVRFIGVRRSEALARAYGAATVAISTSLGRAAIPEMMMALACGAPLAALPGEAAFAVLGNHGRGQGDDLPMTVGAIDEDIAVAIDKAVRLDRLGAAVHGARLLRAAADGPRDPFVCDPEPDIPARAA